jgi:hypothetical protein
MSNRKKRRKNIGPNKQWRRNPKTGKLEKFQGKSPRKQPTEKKEQPVNKALTPGELRELKRKNHPSKGFIPSKPKPTFRPCVCEGIDVELSNAEILEDLKREERAYDEETETYTVLVINRRFRRKHARHMRHFRTFLRDEKIRFVEV